MKHPLKITFLLLAMFLLAQIIAIGVTASYASFSQGTLPSWIEPPKDIAPQTSLFSIIFAIALGVVIMFVLMKFKAELFLRLWFFLVVIIAISITLNAGLSLVNAPFIFSIITALPLAISKIFMRNIKVHNFTELLIYPGVASLFVPILNLLTIIILLIAISIYDMYAVWHSGIMQKMAKYQINQVKIFTGFFIPYLKNKDRELINNSKPSKKALKNMKLKVNVAILGGGDIVFPAILAGVVYLQLGFLSALIVSMGALAGLAFLFYKSEKGKFYPAMPFITVGCFIALGLVYLLSLSGLL